MLVTFSAGGSLEKLFISKIKKSNCLMFHFEVMATLGLEKLFPEPQNHHYGSTPTLAFHICFLKMYSSSVLENIDFFTLLA